MAYIKYLMLELDSDIGPNNIDDNGIVTLIYM